MTITIKEKRTFHVLVKLPPTPRRVKWTALIACGLEKSTQRVLSVLGTTFAAMNSSNPPRNVKVKGILVHEVRPRIQSTDT